MDSKCDAFSFLSFFIFPSFFKPPAAGSPCCGRFAFDRELPVVSFRGAKRRANLRENASQAFRTVEKPVQPQISEGRMLRSPVFDGRFVRAAD